MTTLDEVLAAAAIVSGVGVDRAAARPAVELGLLTVAGAAYAFAHPLIGSALRQAMSRERREQGHAALAAVLCRPPRACGLAPRQLGVRPRRACRGASWSSGRRWPAGVGRSPRRSPGSSGRPRSARTRSTRPRACSALPRWATSSAGSPQVEQIKDQVTRMTLRPRDRSRLTWLTGAFHDGATSDPSDVRHLVDLARDATADADIELAMQLLFGAARRVWWRDPGEVVRREIVSATRAVPLPAADPRVLAVLGLAESLELSGPVMEQLDRVALDGGGPADIAALLGIAAFCAGDFVRAESSLSTAIHGLRAEGRLSLLAEALAIRAWAEINLGVFDPARSADEGMRLADETGQRVWAGTARLAVALIDAVGGGWDARHRAARPGRADRAPAAQRQLVAAGRGHSWCAVSASWARTGPSRRTARCSGSSSRPTPPSSGCSRCGRSATWPRLLCAPAVGRTRARWSPRWRG